MSVISGMNLGIRVIWNEIVDGQTVEYSEDIRNHWTNDGLFTTTGDVELVFLLKVYGLDNKDISSVILYFDPPTNTYIPNEGIQECTIYSLEFFKSSELNLKSLNIIAESMTVEYNGQPIEFVAENECDYEMIIEYSSGSDWTTEAPINAGTYNVRIKFLGSLTYDYSVFTSTLTIKKATATVKETDVYVDPETGIVTISKGIVAALSEDFSKESLIKTGFIVEDNSTIYFYHPADENHHTASETLSILVKLNSNSENPGDELPTEPEKPSGSENPELPTEPEINDTETSVDDNKENDGGCNGNIITSIFGILALFGVVSILKRKMKE